MGRVAVGVPPDPEKSLGLDGAPCFLEQFTPETIEWRTGAEPPGVEERHPALRYPA